MNIENKKIEKICGFYVSDWHLITMLLPYVNSKIQENVKITTILENKMEEKIKILLKKLSLKNEKEILNINWNSLKSKKYTDISKTLKKQIQTNKENLVLINGSKEYIEKNNINIEKWMKTSKIKNIKIINFFEITEFNNNIIEILDNHNKILNTSGEREIAEVFEGYTEKEKKYS